MVELSERDTRAIFRQENPDGWTRWQEKYLYQGLLKICSLAGVSPRKKSCLDVGCGTGKFSRLWNAAGGGGYTGLDINESVIQLARTNNQAARFQQGEFLATQGIGQYDFVFLSGVAWIRTEDIGRNEYLEALLRKARSIAKIGVAFNYQTGRSGGDLSSYEMQEVREISRKVASGWTVKTNKLFWGLTSDAAGYIYKKPFWKII